MTPTKESLDRARVWRLANTEIIERVNGSSYIKWNRSPDEFETDLALLLDRVRLEGKIDGIREIERHKWTAKGKFMSNTDWLHEWQSELAALNQPAGEKEG